MHAFSLQQADLIRMLQSDQSRRVIWVVNLLLVVWIASMLATLTWDMFSTPDATDEPVTVTETTSAPVPVNPDRQLITQLPGWHLMGVASQGDKPIQTNTAVDAPETKLKLVLKGAYASDAPEHARAIIADPRGKEEEYAIGEKLPGNAELSEIHPDRIILKRNGRYETLRLPKEKVSINTIATRTVSARSTASPRERLSSARQQLKNGPAKMGDLLRASPKRGSNGSTIGYTLSPGRDPDLFREVGLQQGDVAIQINNIKLDNPANSARALKSMQSGDSVTVTVLRNGQEETVTLDWPE